MLKKRILFIAVILLTLLVTTNVYAVTVLNSNLLDFIRSGISHINVQYQKLLEKDLEKANIDYIDKIKEYVLGKEVEVNNELSKHQNAEINRAEKELNSFYNQIEIEGNKMIEEELDLSKGKITQKVNEEIVDNKEEMLEQLEVELNSNLK